MMHGEMMGMGPGMGIFMLVYFGLAALIFSIIFWLTYNWLADKKKK